MKKIIFLLVCVAFFLDFSFFPMLNTFFFSSANFLVIMIVAIILRRSFNESVGWAIFGGLLLDYVSSSFLGMHVLIFLLLVFLLNFVRNKLFSNNLGSLPLFVIFASAVVFFGMMKLLIYKMLSLAGVDPALQMPLVHPLGIVTFGVVTALLGVVLHGTLRNLEHITGEGTSELQIDKKH